MKKIILASLCLASAFSFTGCVSEEDDIFSASAPVRLDEAAKTYTERLAAATGGWSMEYYPTTETASPKGNGYLMLAKFFPNLSVTVGMKNQFCSPANSYNEDTSSWEVITDNGPVLTFDTYNKCLHTFSSPEDLPSTSNNETGVGLEGDYEFVMIDVPEDGEFVMLKGKKRGTYARLTRLPENTDFEAYFDDIESFTKTVLPSTAPNVCMLTMGDSISKMSNGSTGIFTIYPYDSEALYGTGHPFLITKRGDNYYLRFRDAVAGPDETEEQEFVYDAERDLFAGVEHPEYVIEGDLPYSFFATSMSESGRTWNLTSSAEMSDDLRERYDGLSSAMSAQGARFNQLSFGYSHDSYVCTLTGRLGNAQLNYNFKFTLTPIDNGYTMHYEGPADDNSTDILESFPEMLDLLNVFNADFTVEATSSRFNMRQLRLSSAAGTYFKITIN